jgi:hypothetical protein
MDENAVSAAVCTYLKNRGWSITQHLHTTQRGDDVVARHPRTGRECYVEVKGGTSARQGSARFGQPFSSSQVFDHVSKAVFAALRLRTRNPDRGATEVVIAVPSDRNHRRHLEPVADALALAGIHVMLVSEGGEIDVLAGASERYDLHEGPLSQTELS